MTGCGKEKKVSESTTFKLTLPEFLIVEVFDGIARLDCYLDQVEIAVHPRSGVPLRLFRDTLSKVLFPSLEEPLRLVRQSTISAVPLSDSEFQALVNQVDSTFIGVAGVHRFLKYLRVPEPPPEIFTLLQEIQDAFPAAGISKHETDVLLSETFNYGEIDLHTAIEWQLQQARILKAVPGEETIVIILPYTQVNNPLMWTIISHEIGHFAEKFHGLGKKVLGKILGCPCEAVTEGTELDWVEELISDAVGTRLFGPAYLFSFVSFTILQSSLGRPSVSHPSELSRVRLAFDELKRTCLTDAVPIAKSITTKIVDLFEEKFRFNEKYLGDKHLGPSTIHNASIADVMNLITQELENLKMSKLSTESLRRSEALAHALANGQPVSALRNERTNLQPRIDALRESLDRPTTDKQEVAKAFFEIRNCMVEDPSTCTEIINAGYIHRYQQVLPQILDGLAGSSLAEYGGYHKKSIAQVDRLLKVSLQATEIHKLFL
jgi:hypothetical protein